ncbi:hypothetical protein ACFPIF_11190 [Brevundimonas faecalis]|uniref:hypothetical protein n=1 Tax=Brevundimonas faecalis TaxID=947378 RepID=UPI0036139CB4
MPEKPRTPEADLAFLRSIVEGGGPKGHLTLGVAYLAGGLLYGGQCLFHIGQFMGWIRWPDLANLAVVVGVLLAFTAVMVWSVREDRRAPQPGPMATRTMNAAFSATGMANLAIVAIFGAGAVREQDFSIWLYYPAVVFAFQAAAWYVAWELKKRIWMLAVAIGGWLTAAALGLLVRDPGPYLVVCTAALFLLFAAPGWVMTRDALKARAAR